MSSLDLIREEEKPVFGVGGGGPASVLEFKGPEYEFEPERFSQDLDWMPNLVLMAKNTYVWLDQLSRKYQRAITRLDQIPDEELDTLARWGFTGLWLIGLWERSPASQRIKQMRGNPDAVASAYSLFSYDIAADLGGEEAYQESARARLAARHPPGLRHGAQPHGHRFALGDRASGLVCPARLQPLPDLYLQRAEPVLGWAGRASSWKTIITITRDAAVVFKRVDYWTGDTRYIYHGNDGTSMPWNDTAQFNYLIPEVREAVIQTILHVARKFPIIRFDAAMTLAKKHYQRLWFPEPGSGGDIPSRAEHGLTKAAVRRSLPGGILARGGRPGGAGSPRYAAAGGGLLADGRLFRAHAGHAPGL